LSERREVERLRDEREHRAFLAERGIVEGQTTRLELPDGEPDGACRIAVNDLLGGEIR
jgi:hypothetical protein